jgi:hypothetical protein
VKKCALINENKLKGDKKMRKSKRKNRIISIVLALVIFFTGVTVTKPVSVSAANQYITIKGFIKSLVINLNLDISKDFSEPYIAAAVSAGILKAGDFSKYTGYIRRTEAAVLINRADEYLHGNTVDTDLLKIVLDKRISDINKVDKTKREAVAKVFAKGIVKGYSNGYYIKNREFRGSGYVSTTTAKSLISMVLNSSKRSKISPDGMLIRTTNLPKNSKNYEYILECYPNSFYERKFEFMFRSSWPNNTNFSAYPVEMRKEKFKNWYKEWPLSEEMDKYLYDWADMAEKYLTYVFNVDYRTVDEDWINGLGSLYAISNTDEADAIRSYYVKHIKNNHVIVKSSIIAVEPSVFYDDNGYCMRAYVRYKITADDITVKQNRLIYTQYPALDNLKSGVWRTGIFDVRFSTNNGSSGDGSDFAIDLLTNFVDAFNVPVE